MGSTLTWFDVERMSLRDLRGLADSCVPDLDPAAGPSWAAAAAGAGVASGWW